MRKATPANKLYVKHWILRNGVDRIQGTDTGNGLKYGFEKWPQVRNRLVITDGLPAVSPPPKYMDPFHENERDYALNIFRASKKTHRVYAIGIVPPDHILQSAACDLHKEDYTKDHAFIRTLAEESGGKYVLLESVRNRKLF